MSTELTMPQMGYDMQEGTVVRWLKAEGAEVAVGEPIAEIETDKAVVEFESYAAGLLGRILVPEGTTVPVGEPIAIVAEEGEELPEVVIQEPEPATEVEAEAVVEEVAPPVEERVPLVTPPPPGSTVPLEDVPVAEARAVRASPVARRLAEERGIDLTEVTGTGPGGRITKDDVLAIEEPSVPEEELPAPADVEPTDEMEPAAEIELAADVAADEPVEVVPVAEVENPPWWRLPIWWGPNPPKYGLPPRWRPPVRPFLCRACGSR